MSADEGNKYIALTLSNSVHEVHVIASLLSSANDYLDSKGLRLCLKFWKIKLLQIPEDLTYKIKSNPSILLLY